jgi:hypothetical protein
MMRPVPKPFSRKRSVDTSPSLDPRTATPATFFLSRSPHVSDLESSISTDGQDSQDAKDNMYGVQSLDETLCQTEFAGSPRDLPADSLKHATDDLESHLTRRRSTLRPMDPDTLDSPEQTSPLSHAVSRPLTPLDLGNPDDPSSLPSSPKSISNQSLRPLDDISITDEINSQAIGSGDEEEFGSSRPLPGGASQLIMPSIKMPSRRPFTERGKAMGRFKLLLAGSPGKFHVLISSVNATNGLEIGSGKTSLIKSIVQTCDDIVHVDTIPSVTSLERRRPPRPRSRGTLITTSEIYASTKPYPSWWSDLEDSRVLRRRKSIGEIVLERNICFVDTPATSLSRAGQTDAVVQYLRQQLLRATSALNDSGVDFQNLLAGNGGSQVDAILYLISNGRSPESPVPCCPC